MEFASSSDMKRALEKLDGTELNGRKLKITEETGRGGGGGGRGYNRRRYNIGFFVIILRSTVAQLVEC